MPIPDRSLKGLIDPLLAAAGLDLGADHVQLGTSGTRIVLLLVVFLVALASRSVRGGFGGGFAFACGALSVQLGTRVGVLSEEREVGAG